MAMLNEEDISVLFNNAGMSVHAIMDRDLATIKAEPYTRYDDFDWFTLEGINNLYWFSCVGSNYYGFDTTTSTTKVLTPQNEGDSKQKVKVRFRFSGGTKIYLSKVIKLWNTRVPVDTVWSSPLRSDQLKPLVYSMVQGISKVNNGKILSRSEVNALVQEWNQKEMKLKWIQDASDVSS